MRSARLAEARLRGDLGCEIALLLLETLAELEANEAADLDVLADLRDQLLLDLLDRLVGVLHERLVEETDLLHPLRELTLDHLLGDRGRLAALDGLRDEHALLVRADLLGDFFLADELRSGPRDLHRD